MAGRPAATALRAASGAALSFNTSERLATYLYSSFGNKHNNERHYTVVQSELFVYKMIKPFPWRR